MPTIKSIHARQILDSRGNPTVEVDTLLDDGTMGVIEGRRNLIGARKDIIVTGALQTPTGRMIFGRLEKNQPPHNSGKTNAPTG